MLPVFLSLRLRERFLADAEFDEVYPASLRAVSASFWTPVSVALRAADLLARGPATRVLDVGSGAGKLCIVGAAATGALFTGVEHRGHLVQAAREAARRWGADSAQFVHGTLDTVDVQSFDAIYFYNPFEENLWSCHGHIDRTVALSRERFRADVALAEELLGKARAGTRVVTYHGFGGEMPSGYRRALREAVHTDFLELWVKESVSAPRVSAPALDRPETSPDPLPVPFCFVGRGARCENDTEPSPFVSLQ